MSGRVANRYFSRAFRWQRKFLLLAIVLIVGKALTYIEPRFAFSTVYSYALWFLSGCVFMAMLVVCYYVFRGSIQSRGVLYSMIHVGLIILLAPACFVGVFAIPSLTNGDALRLRDWERQQQGGA